MKRFRYIILVIVAFVTVDMQAQRSDYASGFQLGVDVQLGVPRNEFAEVFNGYPVGIAAIASLPVGKSGLFRFGGEFAYASMGEKTQVVELVDQALGTLRGDLELSSRIQSYHVFFRLAPFDGAIRPYADVFFGMKIYSTTTDLLFESGGNDYRGSFPIDRDYTNSYGAAGGILLALGEHVFLDAKLQMIRGGEIEYVDLESVTLADVDAVNDLNFSLETTSTDMLIPQVGLSIFF